MVRLRPVLPLVLLALFPVLVGGLLLVLATGVVKLGAYSGLAGAKLAMWLVVPLVLAVGVAVRDALRALPGPTAGPELLRADHPRLWAEVDALAAGLGTEPPQRIVVVPEVNAFVTEVGGRRELGLGLPLLATLDRAQLRAVVAHELGHFGAGHTRLTALAFRARTAAGAVLANLEPSPARWLVERYLRLYLVVAAWASRDAEREADAYASRVAGSESAAAMLRRIAEVDAAWSLLLRDYASLAGPADRSPRLLVGLHHLMAARAAELEEAVTASLARETTSPYDSHPTTASRIAGLLAVPVRVPESPDHRSPATTLLSGGIERLHELERALQPAGIPVADWDEVVARAGAHVVAEAAGDLARSAPLAGVPVPVTVGGVLDAVERGEGTRLVADLVRPGLAAAARAEVEPPLLHHLLTSTVAHALCRSGRFVHRVDWTGPWRLTSTENVAAAVDLGGLMTQVLANPALVPELRSLLARQGADLDAPLEQGTAYSPALLGIVTRAVGADRRRYDLLACTTGLLVLPSPAQSWSVRVQQLLGQERLLEGKRAGALADTPLDALRARPGARWLSDHELLAGALTSRRSGWTLEVRVRAGLPVSLRASSGTQEHGPALQAVAELLGDRFGDRAMQASTLGVPVAG